MKLFLVTCASDQPLGFALAVRYVARCVKVLPVDVEVRWLIADDGHFKVPTPRIDRVEVSHLQLPPAADSCASFRSNLLAVLPVITSEAGFESVVAVIEDDWLAYNYLADAIAAFRDRPDLLLFGETRTRYYRLDNRRWYIFKSNGRSALSATVMRSSLLPFVRTWATESRRTIMLDDELWQTSTIPNAGRFLLPESQYVVGIKRLPGKLGLGLGHWLNEKHFFDFDGSVLRKWIGDTDATLYEYIRGQSGKETSQLASEIAESWPV